MTVGVGDRVEVGIWVGVVVGVNTSAGKASRVSAAAVFKFDTTESRTSAGSIAMAVAIFRSCIAIPETEHSRLIPRAAAPTIARSPR